MSTLVGCRDCGHYVTIVWSNAHSGRCLGCASRNAEVTTLRTELAQLRAAVVRECAAVCDAFYEELANADIRDRLDRSGLGRDEHAVAECEQRILALLGTEGE